MSTRAFRFVSTDRFVVGKGRFAADIAAAGTWHVALVTCLHPAASTRRKRWPSPLVYYLLDGRELAAEQPLLAGLTSRKCRGVRLPWRSRATPANGWRPSSQTRTRSLKMPPSWDYQALPRRRSRLRARRPVVHADFGSNMLLDHTFV